MPTYNMLSFEQRPEQAALAQAFRSPRIGCSNISLKKLAGEQGTGAEEISWFWRGDLQAIFSFISFPDAKDFAQLAVWLLCLL